MPKLKRFTLSVLVDLTMQEVGEVNLPHFDWQKPLDFVRDIAQIGRLIRRFIVAVETVESKEHPGYKYYPEVGIKRGQIKQRAVIKCLMRLIPIPKPLLIVKAVINFFIWFLNDILGHDWLHTATVEKIKERDKFALANDNIQPPDNDTIEDGFGSIWSAWCPTCGRKSMEVVRPGKCQCSYCG
jgi:hypothetical protein